MTMSYMNEVCYNKPIQLEVTRKKKRKNSRMESSCDRAETSRKAGSSNVKSSTSMLMITDVSLGHGIVVEDDDDFVDPLPRWQERSTMTILIRMRVHQLTLILGGHHN